MVDLGVTIYSTVPAVALLGLVSTWAMVPAAPELAPVMLPVIAPTVHWKVLGADEDKLIFVLVPLQIEAVLALVTTGVGSTVTVIR